MIYRKKRMSILIYITPASLLTETVLIIWNATDFQIKDFRRIFVMPNLKVLSCLQENVSVNIVYTWYDLLSRHDCILNA